MDLIKKTEEWVIHGDYDDFEFKQETNEKEFANFFSINTSFTESPRLSRKYFSEKQYRNNLLIEEYKYDVYHDNFNDEFPFEESKKFEYDAHDRLLKEIISLKYSSSVSDRIEIYQNDYSYEGNSYVKIKKKKKSGLLPVYVDGYNVISSNDGVKDLDQIELITEVKFSGSNKLWEKTTILQDNESSTTKYHYDYSKLFMIEGKHEVDGITCDKSEYGDDIETHYLNSKICLQKKFKNGKLIEKTIRMNQWQGKNEYKTFKYNADGLLKEIAYEYFNYEYFDDKKTVGPILREEFIYDELGNLLVQKYYSLNNGEEFLFKLKSIDYREFIPEKVLKNSNREKASKKLPSKITIKMHESRKKLKSTYCFDKENYIIFQESDNVEYQGDFIITIAKYNLYNDHGQIIQDKEFEFGNLKNETNYRYDNKLFLINKESLEYYDNKYSQSKFEIFTYNENGNINENIEMNIRNNVISSQKIKRYFYKK